MDPLDEIADALVEVRRSLDQAGRDLRRATEALGRERIARNGPTRGSYQPSRETDKGCDLGGDSPVGTSDSPPDQRTNRGSEPPGEVKPKRSGSPSPRGRGGRVELHPSVESLCSLMEDHANKMARTPGKARVTQAWRLSMERLIRLDGRRPDQIEWVIRWVSAHSFWSANVLSVPTLRRQFDKLVAQAGAHPSRALGDNGPSPAELARRASQRLREEDLNG